MHRKNVDRCGDWLRHKKSICFFWSGRFFKAAKSSEMVAGRVRGIVGADRVIVHSVGRFVLSILMMLLLFSVLYLGMVDRIAQY